MILNRKDIFKQYPWLNEQKHKFIISADYNGLICASFLSHILSWELVGYYDLESLWICEQDAQNYNDIIWVDLNILPKLGRAIGGHIVSLPEQTPMGFQTSCNPNLLVNLTSADFKNKFPFSTLIFLLWLHNYQIKKTLFARLLVLHSDDTWLKCQEYNQNVNHWVDMLPNFNWKWLLQKVDKSMFEERVDQILYPELNQIGAVSAFGKLKSKKLNITSKQFQCNPDWDENIILNLFNLFGNELGWTPPTMPIISKCIVGNRQKNKLSVIKKYGLSKFLLDNAIFSYAIPSPEIFNYTSFKKNQKSHILD
tara:strand:- start:914 stop:1843 length:930 start_codon:yes stop_codon:yes gene_type:complete